MKNKTGILILCFFCQFMIGQTTSRKALHGQVINDSLALESGYVLNISAKNKTFISANGLFDIMAKPKDTLLFSSLAFQSKKIVLTEKNCTDRLFQVQLDLVNNELKEVVVQKGLKVKSLDSNTQKYVDLLFEDDKQSTAKNSVAYSDQTIKYGTDFVRIFKDVKKLLKKKDDVKDDYIDDVAFVQYAKVNFSPDFYSKTLHLKPDEIDLFLMYSSADPESKKHLTAEEKFQLMDFLISKNEEFKKVNFTQK